MAFLQQKLEHGGDISKGSDDLNIISIAAKQMNLRQLGLHMEDRRMESQREENHTEGFPCCTPMRLISL